MSMKTVFSKIFGTSARLSKLETIILNSVRAQLSGKILSLWDSQIHSINKIQRLPEGVEVNFYRIKNGHPSFDAGMAFPDKKEELLIARVNVEFPHSDNALIAKIWCVKGFLFSIEYEGSANYFEEAAGMDPMPDFNINTEIKTDLSESRGQ